MTVLPAALLPVVLACAGQSGAKPEPPAARPPNLVLILADDLGYGDPTCYDADSKIPTPNIDRLAAEGLRMTDAHSPSSVCSPTRYALLTGRYAWREALPRDVLWGDSPNLIRLETVTLPEVLSTRGYRSLLAGKWHLGLGAPPHTDWDEPLRPGPLDHGFDEFFGIAGALDMPPYVYIEGDRPVEPATVVLPESELRRFGGGGFWRAGPAAKGFEHEEVLSRITDRAVRFLESCKEEEPERPFFLYFSLTAPHTPWVPRKEFQGKSRAGWYGDQVVELDFSVGRVLDALERLDLVEDTLVCFTSDNGAHWTPEDVAAFDHRANGPWRGQKADIYEGGHRVPFLVRWPGHVPAGAVRDELLCLTDLYPSFAALAGAEVPAGEAPDGVDQTAVWLDEELDAPPREEIVHHAFDGMLAVRRGSWKLVEALGSGGFTPPYRSLPRRGEPPGQLYDLAKDPGEETNLWDAEPERRDELLGLLRRYRTGAE